jgi:molybdate transport system ATP-binding protein
MGSPRLQVNIQKRLAGCELSVQFEAGAEILVLFGPSGAGKTQTLNAIAGLTTPEAGEIMLDGVAFFRNGRGARAVNLPARRRRVGYVFQHYALFPHLTARENVEYPLWRQPEARERAQALLERMGLEPLAERYPHELSGGQQQRVAIARALAQEPAVLLLDEPFSALESALRESLQEEVRRLQAESGLVVIYVTHQLDDALAAGHWLAVMRAGRVEQVGEVEAVCERPASPAVAQILGVPNVFQARVVSSSAAGVILDWGGLRVEAPPQPCQAGELVTARIRPEDLEMISASQLPAGAQEEGRNQIAGRVVRRRPVRGRPVWRIALANGEEIEAAEPTAAARPRSWAPGDELQLSLRKEAIVVAQGLPGPPDGVGA